MAPGGVIYCISPRAKFLSLTRSESSQMTLQMNMDQSPEKLGLLFEQNEHGKTTYESAVTKFGKEKVFQAIEACVPSHVAIAGIIVESFFVAAACENSAVSVIYYLLRKDDACIRHWNTRTCTCRSFALKNERIYSTLHVLYFLSRILSYNKSEIVPAASIHTDCRYSISY
jgi:hypothetical protein